MENIELVIKLPKKAYNHIMSMQFCIPGLRSGKSLLEEILKAIRTGTPLPKGHGRIGDLDLAYEAIEDYQDLIRSTGKFDADKASALTLLGRCKELISEVDEIIEADKEQTDE